MNTYDAALQTERDKSARDMEICKRYVVCDVPDEGCLFEPPRSNMLSAFHEDYEADSADPVKKNEVGVHTSARTRRSKEHYAAKRAEYEKSRKHLCAAENCTVLVSRQATYCPHHAQQRARRIVREHKQSSIDAQV